MAIDAAKKAARRDIRIDTFGIGDKALAEPVVVLEMAKVTGGVFTPVRNPRDLKAVFENVNLSDIDEIKIRNATTGTPAGYEVLNADGSFSALVPVREGANTLEVYARSTDGTEATRQVRVRFMKRAGVQPLEPRQTAERNRLLENRLIDLQRRRLDLEAERDESVRRDLQIEIEEERGKAAAQAAKRRKELEIELAPN